jgi:hypothetical protein
MQTSFRVRLPLINGRTPGNPGAGNLLGAGSAVAAWSHCDWRFELGLVLPDGTTLDESLDYVASISLEAFESRGASTAVLSRTVAIGDMNGGCTAANWTAGTDQHLVIEFTNLETAFSFATGVNSKGLWVVIYGLTTDSPAHRVVLWAGDMTVYRTGAPAGGVVIANGNLVAAEAVYDGDGVYVVSGLVTGQLYEWVKGAEDINLVCGGVTLTESGIFQAGAGTATLTGNPDEEVTAVVRSAGTYTAAQVDARIASAAPVQFETITIKDQGTGLYVALAVRDGGVEVVS